MSRSLPDDIVRALAARLAAEPDVLAAGLFGSAALGRLRDDSDIDIYVRLVHGAAWPLRHELDLATDLAAIVGRDIDLVVEDRARTSVLLRREVARRSLLLFEREPGAWATVRIEGNAAYLDLKPLLDRCARAVQRRAREVAGG